MSLVDAMKLLPGNVVMIRDSVTETLHEVRLDPVDIVRLATLPEWAVCCYPIPVHDKFLMERCGMNCEDTKSAMLKVSESGTDKYAFITRAFLPHGGYVLNYKDVRIPLTSVHHLQNVLYFMLGVELPIK